MGILAVASVVTGVLGAGASIWNRHVQDKETRKDLKIAQNNLTASYEQTKRQEAESLAIANRQLNESYELNKSQTEAMRDLSLKQNATGQAMQNELANAQMAQLQVQSEQAEGSAVQAVATSGLRGVGSANNIIKDTQDKSEAQKRQASLQVDINRHQSYTSALNNYLNSNYQLEQYKLQLDQNLENNELNYRQNMENLDLEYQQKSEAIQRDKDFMNSFEYKFSQGVGYASDIFGAVSSVYNIAKSEDWGNKKGAQA